MSDIEPIEIAVRNRLVFAVQQREPLAWIKKLIDLNANCIGNAFPQILKINPQPSFEVIQLLVEKCPIPLVSTVLSSIIDFDPPPSFEVLHLLAEKCPPGSMPSSVFSSILKFKTLPSFELIQLFVEKLSTASVYAFLSSLLQSKEPPNFKLIRLLLEKYSAAVKRPDYKEFYLLHHSCNFNPDFEIIQHLVNSFPFACLKVDEANPCLLPLEIVKRKTSDKRIIDFLTKATTDMACVFVESGVACRHKTNRFFDHNSHIMAAHETFGTFSRESEIIRADGSLDFERLLSPMHGEEIGKMMRYRRGGNSFSPSNLLRCSNFLNVMEQINEINKAKREFDERTAVPFPDEPKTIISSN